MYKKALPHLLLSSLFLFTIIFHPSAAHAYGGGVSGYSGKNGSTCTQCHSTGTSPTVTITGPTSVASGATVTYTLTAVTTGSAAGGLDVASSAGTFTAGSGTQVMNGEITHTSASSSLSWTFGWTAPKVTTTTTETLYGAAIDSFGGGTGTATSAITVTAGSTNPSLTATPGSLNFSYTIGGTNPASQSLAVSAGSALTYTVASSGGSWLTATGGGTTPGNVSVSVNPANMTAGTYNGSVTITSSGASNSPMSVPVTLTIANAGGSAIAAKPTSLSFSYTSGGTAPAAQTIALSSSTSTALSYTVAAWGGTWLSASGSGSTPGSVGVSVTPGSLGAGTYNGKVTITSSGASNSPLTVPVTLTISSSGGSGGGGGTGSMTVSPAQLVFYSDGADPAPHSLTVTSGGSTMSYTAEAFGGSWMSLNSSGGSTPGKVSVSVFATGLPAGTYSGVVQIKSGRSSSTVEVVFVVGGRSGGGGSGGAGDDASRSVLQPFSFDPGGLNSVSASVQASSAASASSPAGVLVLNKSTSAPPTALAGALLAGSRGTTLKRLGYDMKAGSECNASSPQFVVVTNDNVTHRAGCLQGRFAATTAAGWQRVTFNPADSTQFTPAIQPGAVAQTVALVINQVEQSGSAVLANVNLNGRGVYNQ